MLIYVDMRNSFVAVASHCVHGPLSLVRSTKENKGGRTFSCTAGGDDLWNSHCLIHMIPHTLNGSINGFQTSVNPQKLKSTHFTRSSVPFVTGEYNGLLFPLLGRLVYFIGELYVISKEPVYHVETPRPFKKPPYLYGMHLFNFL